MTLATAVPALAQSPATATLAGAAPLAIAVGAGAFALLAMAVVRTMQADGKKARRKAAEQIAGLRALVDEYEALLSGVREVTVLWTENDSGAPKFSGRASAVVPTGRQPESILNFHSRLANYDAEQLGQSLEALRVHGRAFSASLTAIDGRLIRANGWVLGGGVALRLRPAFLQPSAEQAAAANAMMSDTDSVALSCRC
ncbi:hypothetical protein N8D56_02100 [Devosia sp. A8/3-2]|nr:hypothetical protein N8D56_02100 [Devosia sp. A8/3-2]